MVINSRPVLTREGPELLKKTAIAYFETQKGVAKALGITQAAVSKWPELIPEKQALRLALLTNNGLQYDPCMYSAKSAA